MSNRPTETLEDREPYTLHIEMHEEPIGYSSLLSWRVQQIKVCHLTLVAWEQVCKPSLLLSKVR